MNIKFYVMKIEADDKQPVNFAQLQFRGLLSKSCYSNSCLGPCTPGRQLGCIRNLENSL